MVTSTGVSVVTGVAQGVSEQKKQNADSSNQARMLKFHLDSLIDSPESQSHHPNLHNGIVTLRNSKLWIEAKSPITKLPATAAHHPFTGFYIAYPDPTRAYTLGLVSTISVNPPVLNWIYIDKTTSEVKFSNRSGSIAHHVGSFDWTTADANDSYITFDGWEGFLAVEEEPGEWAVYFDLEDDGLREAKRGRKTVEVRLRRRVLREQELNRWGLAGEGNIGFKKTREV